MENTRGYHNFLSRLFPFIIYYIELYLIFKCCWEYVRLQGRKPQEVFLTNIDNLTLGDWFDKFGWTIFT